MLTGHDLSFCWRSRLFFPGVTGVRLAFLPVRTAGLVLLGFPERVFFLPWVFTVAHSMPRAFTI